MAQVSKYPLSSQVYEQIIELLQRVVSESYSKEEATSLLDDLLTPTEKIVLAKRLAVALLLTKKYSYNEIRKILRVSNPTIAMVNMTLKYKGQGYKQFTEKILREEKTRQTWQKIEGMVLKSLSQEKGKGGIHWRYLRQELQYNRFKERTPIKG